MLTITSKCILFCMIMTPYSLFFDDKNKFQCIISSLAYKVIDDEIFSHEL